MGYNDRVSNGAEWRKLRARVKARGAPCWICGKPIDYSLRFYIDPKDGKRKLHPDSWELDEIDPHALGGKMRYNNVAAAHRRCNQARGARLKESIRAANYEATRTDVETSREW